DGIKDTVIANEATVHLFPTLAELSDREEREIGESCHVALKDLGVRRAIEVPGDGLLGFFGVQEFQVSQRSFARSAAIDVGIDNGHVRSGLNTDGRVND